MSHEFKIILDGIDLPKDREAKLEMALHNAVVSTLADLYQAGPGSVAFLPISRDLSPQLGGMTAGMVARRMEATDVRSLLRLDAGGEATQSKRKRAGSK